MRADLQAVLLVPARSIKGWGCPGGCPPVSGALPYGALVASWPSVFLEPLTLKEKGPFHREGIFVDDFPGVLDDLSFLQCFRIFLRGRFVFHQRTPVF